MTDQPNLTEPEDLLPEDVAPEADALPAAPPPAEQTAVAPDGLTVSSDEPENPDAPGGAQTLMSSGLI